MGESHKKTRKPCQDCSALYSDEESGIHVALVCDGHGGARYFRSDTGSRLLVSIASEKILEFIRGVPEELFSNTGLVQVGPDEHPSKYAAQETALKRLFASIICQWQEEIEKDARSNPITFDERRSLKQEHLMEFLDGINLEKYYGSTLMAYFQTNTYWIAFHIGDGHCVMFTNEGDIFEPVPWDDKCFLNSTTSICDQNALTEFRYAWQGGGIKPFAVFLGSDGIDDSFGDGERLHGFYLDILRSILADGIHVTEQSLVEELPVISAKGSQDDMSISFLYDEQELVEKTGMFTAMQLSGMQKELDSLRSSIAGLEARRDTLTESYSELQLRIEEQEKRNLGLRGRIERIRNLIKQGEQECKGLEEKQKELEASKPSLDYQGEKMRIELKYANNDLERAYSSESRIVSRMETLKKTLDNLQDPDSKPIQGIPPNQEDNEEEVDCKET